MPCLGNLPYQVILLAMAMDAAQQHTKQPMSIHCLSMSTAGTRSASRIELSAASF